MNDRNRSDNRYRQDNWSASRQPQQFQSGSSQMGGWYEDDDDTRLRERSRQHPVREMYRSGPDYASEESWAHTGNDSTAYGYTAQGEPRSRWSAPDRSGFAGESFASGYGMSDGGREDYGRSRRYAGTSGGAYSGLPYGERGYGDDRNRDERGFFARASDEVASWFGDEDAQRRREADHRGHGPADYTRSDERIREDVNDRLTDDWRIDARRIAVKVSGGEVTLDGTVTSRAAKRRAEDLADDISGVKHVQNNLRVAELASGDLGIGTKAAASTKPTTAI